MRTVQFMPYGTDPLAAAKVARRAAAITGGVVMPPVFIGTERERSPGLLEDAAFVAERAHNAYRGRQ
ncbi:MAG: hypothetical protein HFG73_07840 [Hungatella sp.]|nr:hypothetical protein [Hungatella sp.]